MSRSGFSDLIRKYDGMSIFLSGWRNCSWYVLQNVKNLDTVSSSFLSDEAFVVCDKVTEETKMYFVD